MFYEIIGGSRRESKEGKGKERDEEEELGKM